MKKMPIGCCLFWASLLCFVYLAGAGDEDLVDFDFADLKEIDWNYDNAHQSKDLAAQMNEKKLTTNMLSFDEDDFDENMNQVRPFDWREKVLRTALSKALTNGALRQKFVEVMPILRVLSSQQRLALSALISAQINARKGHELKLDQVRMMFGDDKNLLVPIVYDIANLVQKSARNYINYEYDLAPAKVIQQQQQQQLQKQKLERRKLDLTPEEELAEDEQGEDIGVISAMSTAYGNDDADEGSLEDFFVEMPDGILDPKEINEELQAVAAARQAKAAETPIKTPTAKRQRRAAAPTPTDFVHKLIRSVPLSVNEDDLQHGVAGQTIKLNKTVFQQPQGSGQLAAYGAATAAAATSETPQPAYYDIEDLAFASLNGTAIDLNVNETANAEEPLPNPEELIAGPRYRIAATKMHFLRPKMTSRKRMQVRPRPKVPPPAVPAPALANSIETPKKCERFTASMCIRTEDYPLEQIMGSIRRHKNAMSALLAEFHDKTTQIDLNEDFEDFPFNKKRREDDGTTGSMCQSIVRYARPQKARSASGEWKYIVNTGQHTQTLRLEKCTTPMESCSYLAQTYRSHCAQVYNYHRLLSWDKARGLHVDIFKVPTCCSCQVDGYRQLYPPLDSVKTKDYVSAYNADSYGALHEDFEYTDDSEEDDELNFGLNNNYKHSHKPDAHLDANELFLGSKKVRTKAFPQGATVGSYLSPPEHDNYEQKYSYKNQPHLSGAKPSSTSASLALLPSLSSFSSSSSSKRHRRPYKSLAANEARVDLEFSPSETHSDKEVNLLGATTHVNAKTRAPQKRKRIYSVPHTSAPHSSSSSSNAGHGEAHTPTPTPTTPTSTTAAATPTTAATPATRTHIRGGASSTATTTNQVRQPSVSRYQPAASGNKHANLYFANSDRSSYSSSSSNHIGGAKTRPRYYTATGSTFSSNVATTTTTTATVSASLPSSSPSSASTDSNKRLQPTSSAHTPSLYQLNSIYSSKFNSSGSSSTSTSSINSNSNSNRGSSVYSNNNANSNRNSNSNSNINSSSSSSSSSNSISNTNSYKHSNGHSHGHSAIPKRINYSYHPIIDFFENHKPQYTDHAPDERLYPYTITKSTPAGLDITNFYQIKERRIGYGASGGVGGGSGGSDSSSSSSSRSSNSNSMSSTSGGQQQESANDTPWHPVNFES